MYFMASYVKHKDTYCAYEKRAYRMKRNKNVAGTSPTRLYSLYTIYIYTLYSTYTSAIIINIRSSSNNNNVHGFIIAVARVRLARPIGITIHVRINT